MTKELEMASISESCCEYPYEDFIVNPKETRDPSAFFVTYSGADEPEDQHEDFIVNQKETRDPSAFIVTYSGTDEPNEIGSVTGETIKQEELTTACGVDAPANCAEA